MAGGMSVAADLPALRHRFAWGAGGVRLHYVERGPAGGEVVLLLHGFPQFWYSWRKLIPVLAEAGYRVVAADLRGYGRSDKPAGVESYGLDLLVADVVALLDGLGVSRAGAVVGHDWGGVIAWTLAARHPERLARLVILNAPHPEALARDYRRFIMEQLIRSLYILAVQPPLLPERLLAARGARGLRAVLRLTGFTDAAAVDRYVTEMSRPGALRSALHYYRAAVREHWRRLPVASPIAAPTLVLWGERDAALSISLTEGLGSYVTGPLTVRRVDATHWVHEEQPAACAEAMLAFLDGSDDVASGAGD